MQGIRFIQIGIALLCAGIITGTKPVYSQSKTLKISENKRFFADQDGKPFFWLADTGWLLFNRLTREEADRYLTDRRQKGFNVVQVMVVQALRTVNVYGDSALVNRDLGTPKVTEGNAFESQEQYDYWDHVDYVVGKAAEKGIKIGMVPIWGNAVKNGKTSAAQAKAYAQFLARRYRDRPNIVWINGGDIQGDVVPGIWEAIGSTLRVEDPNHLITFHPFGRMQSSKWFHGREWLDFNMFQSGHRTYAQDVEAKDLRYGEDNWRYVEADYARTPVKPVLDGEPSYENIWHGLHDKTRPVWTADDVRRYAYWSVFAGACGFTYGNNAVMQMRYATDPKLPSWEEAINDPGAGQMMHLKNLILSKPYFERVPDQSIVAENGERYDRLLATRGKDYALIYTWNGRDMKINMGKIDGGNVHASWYNPRTGETQVLGKIKNSGIKTFNPPGEVRNGNDWVLVLENRIMQKKLTGILALCLAVGAADAQDTIRYTGKTLVNVDYHHGQLSPAIGVHSYQTLRANRTDASRDSAITWTYNHAPMLAYWNGTFYLNYLSNPVGEHIPPGQTLLQTSKDGKTWTKPVAIFPPYKIPDGTQKEGHPGVAKDLYAVMHQRMGFYTSKSGRLLTLAYFGMVLDAKDDPNDGHGIGRVVREIKKDGTYGPIYFIRHNASWKAPSDYPMYTESKDKGFVEACDELLSNKLVTQQWVEEADRNDPVISLKGEYKAFSYYHLPDGRVVGLWKNALTSISKNEGKTWLYNPKRAPGFVNSNAKIWGQKTSDGKYATVYNPSEFRWPLAVSVSDDGLNYKNLLLVNGEITSMRYGGNYKSYGPQYVRGISEGDGTPPDGNLWVAYSMNKEDIWVSGIPVPVRDKAEKHASDRFAQMPDGKELAEWNIYSPLQAPVSIGKSQNGKALVIKDADHFDYARVERVIPASKKLVAEFSVTPNQNNTGLLDVEFLDAKGTPGIRLSFDSTGVFRLKAGYRNKTLLEYQNGQRYDIKVQANTETRLYSVVVNGKQVGTGVLFAPLEAVSRIAFRTGDTRRFPDADTPTDQMYDLPNGGMKDPEAVFVIDYLITKSF